jgi:hypothetical protein
MVRWTAVVGVFTFFLSLFTALQFWASVQSERAFLSVASLTINGGFPQAGDPTIRVFFQVKNGGRTTAFPERAVLAMHVGQLPSKPEYGDEPKFALPPVAVDGTANDHDVIPQGRHHSIPAQSVTTHTFVDWKLAPERFL